MKDLENYDNRLFQILNNESFSSEFIAGIAGDRIQGPDEKKLYAKLLQESGDDFYVKLLFFITHEVFEESHAIELWKEIIDHKNKLSAILNRNVEITVATLDYLSNIKNELSNPQLIGEAFIGKIAEISSVDPLTKLFNRQHLKQVLDNEFIRYQRYKIPFSIVFIDIDNFKKINDTHGHQIGDKVLLNISNIIIKDLRDLDVCTRYGGDEFLLVLPHTNQSKAYDIGERIRRNIELKSTDLYAASLSIGISCCPYHATSVEALIKVADNATYASKLSGKNKTTMKRKLF